MVNWKITEIEFPYILTKKAREKIRKIEGFWSEDGNVFKFKDVYLDDKVISDISNVALMPEIRYDEYPDPTEHDDIEHKLKTKWFKEGKYEHGKGLKEEFKEECLMELKEIKDNGIH